MKYRLLAKIAFAIFSIVTIFGLQGCDPKHSEDAQNSHDEAPMTIKETISKYSAAPVGQSIGPVARCLARTSVLVAIEDLPKSSGEKLRIKVGADNQGKLWAYMYTDQEEFSTAFPEGGKFAEMAFGDAFRIVESDERFGGIYINRNPGFMYLIPRELFADVQQTMTETIAE